MGGSPNLLMPVTPAYTASWLSHTHRSPKSSEPGTDMFVPIGTPVYAPADGRIYGFGTSIIPATGRWVGIDFDNGLRFRAMHLSRLERTSGRIKRGNLIGYSGASGYGYENWSRLSTMPGAHVHVTLWPDHASRFGYRPNGTPYTVDFMQYVGGPTTAPTTPPASVSKEDGNMQSIMINGNQYGVDVEFITHYGTTGQAEITRKVTSATDELHELGTGPAALTEFGDLLDGLGIPRDVLDNQGRVKNPQSGKFEANGTWSRRREILAEIASLRKALGK